MNTIDLGFLAGSILLAIGVLVRSPYYRAIVLECVLHPFSDGWIDRDDENGVYIHRGEALPDPALTNALRDLAEARQSVEKVEQERLRATVSVPFFGNKHEKTEGKA